MSLENSGIPDDRQDGRISVKLKKPVLLFAMLWFAAASYADVTWFTPSVKNFVSGGMLLSSNSGFSPYVDENNLLIPSFFGEYTVETPQLYGTAGVRLSAKTEDFTARMVYWPLFWHSLNAGAGVTYHFLDYGSVFFEQDLLAGLFVRFARKSFSLTTDVDYFYKWTRIYAVQDYIPWITNKSLAVNSTWSWFVLDHLDFYFSISSYAAYRYLLFFAPDFMTGFDWRFDNGVTAGAEFNLQYIDMMTLSSYLASVELRVFTKWELR